MSPAAAESPSSPPESRGSELGWAGALTDSGRRFCSAPMRERDRRPARRQVLLLAVATLVITLPVGSIFMRSC